MWQPIETAPKDGTRIDLWILNDSAPPHGWRLADVFWNGHAWVVWRLGRQKDNFGCVETEEVQIANTITHWMPLPASPLGSAQ